jgi:LDH2 family malate/lactate/ureidoglycolate dehydrogenase
VIRITQYVREIREGELDPKVEPAVLKDAPSWALVDGKYGFGHEASRFSMALAIEKARAGGVGVVSAIRCNHIGRLGEWVEQAAEAGMFGLASVGLGQPSSQMVAPYGGAGRALSTNPVAMAAPRAEAPPLILDFATSVSAEGKVRVARDKGVQLPPGVILDKNGNPSTDPNDLYAGGALQPVGGHKGYALGFFVDVLCLALSGADEPENYGPTGDNSGSFFLAIDPLAFRPDGGFTRSIERLCQRVTSVPPAPGFAEILLPGDPEHRSRQARARAVELPPATWQAIAADAAKLGVATPAV